MSDWFLLTLAGEGGSFLSPLLLLPQKLYTFLGDLSSIDPNDNTADKNRGRSGRSNLLWDNAGQARGRATFRAALPLATLKNAFYFPVIHFTIRSLSAAMRFTVSVKYLGPDKFETARAPRAQSFPFPIFGKRRQNEGHGENVFVGMIHLGRIAHSADDGNETILVTLAETTNLLGLPSLPPSVPPSLPLYVPRRGSPCWGRANTPGCWRCGNCIALHIHATYGLTRRASLNVGRGKQLPPHARKRRR